MQPALGQTAADVDFDALQGALDPPDREAQHDAHFRRVASVPYVRYAKAEFTGVTGDLHGD
jgi:hypothetical protein